MPYAPTHEEADVKLSHDLFYLHSASGSLGLPSRFKTIKTGLKASGR